MSSPRSLARAGRIGWIATLFFTVAAAVASAADPPPPPPPVTVPPIVLPDTLLYIHDIRVGRSDCATCPPIACPGEPVPVEVRGEFPNGCFTFRGLRLAPNRGLFPLLVADIVVDTCGAGCSQAPVPFTGSAELPATGPGSFSFAIQERFRTCPDTTVVSLVAGRVIPYQVQQQCAGPPPPVDSLVRTFVRLEIVPPQPCAGDSVTLRLLTNGCPPCVDLVSFGKDPATGASFAGVFDWRPNCVEFACIPETLSAPMGRLNAGSYHVLAPMTVHVLGTDNPDSTIQFRLPLDFQVGPTCGGPPPLCVVREMFSTVPAHQCALTIAPGDTGNVPLLYSSDLPMAGVQGSMHVPPPFRFVDLRLASDVIGAHLSWYMVRGVPDGVRWVVFTDPGVSLAPGTLQHLLDATITVDPMAPRGYSQLMTASITLASDADGHELPLCDRATLEIIAIRLCVAAAENSACDVNHDGRLDVRDLVRLVGCLRQDLIDTTRTCVDCDSSGTFDLNDIFCCAGDILRGPGVPRDSVHSDGAVSVSFDPIEALGGSGDLLVRVRVGGARALGAAMLRFDYPATGWRASLPVWAQSRIRPVDADWYPLADVSQPGRIDVGGVRLGDSGAGEFVFEVVMTPTVVLQRDPAELTAVTADLAARNGAVITPLGALPSVVLAPGATSGGNALALSPARPNPFNGSTTFAIRLPATAPVDLAVHDLAGRRIATLAHAVYGPGEHSFSWDGTGARDGLYFVRLTVNGEVLSTRVAMLRGSR